MKKTLFLLLLTLLFTGCIERGHMLKPAPVTVATVATVAPPVKKIPTKTQNTKPKHHSALKSPVKTKMIPETKVVKIVSTHTKVESIHTKKEKSFFPLSEETKNRISGFFIIVIGIIILF